MNQPIAIRLAKPTDGSAIAALSTDLGYPCNTETMHKRLAAVAASSSDLLVVATGAGDAPIGWLQAHSMHVIEAGFRVYIVGLIVSSAVRRAGVGRRLVETAESWAASIGADTILVQTNVKRIESHAFYAALGFEPTKTQQVYRKALRANSSPPTT